ncbi:hypothetical protein DTO169C6_4796 [Paecilomyces variotii]|nr:hypothetical protein DTO169C6_4796 [Paecilomyces variotii]
MVLVTSSTISVILSSSVVCIFTFLLFLSGYVLQQQSVRSIQHAIRPPLDSPHKISPHLVARDRGADDQLYLNEASSNYAQDVLSGTRDEDDILSNPTGDTAGKGNYAYLQLVSDPDPSNICSAILFFKTLSKSRSSVHDRLFMYPQVWDMMNEPSKQVSMALSLLRDASTKYDFWLLPIDMSLATKHGYQITDSKLLRLGQIQFLQYDSVLYLQSPGLLLDGEKLDQVLLSRPLPLTYNKDRIESYRNDAWIAMPLKPEREPNLPPVYLIAVNNMGDHVEARTHIPNVAIPGFGELVTGPWGGENPDAAYVFFEKDHDGHVRWEDNPLFGTWRAQQNEVCEGLNLDVN